MNEIILFTISALPVILIAIYIYKKDKEKEPLHLLIKLFLAGIGSCFLVILLTFILESIFPFFKLNKESLSLFELFISVFIGIAFIEELCKWIMAYFISFNNKENEEIYDTIIYTVFVSLGFAFFENLLYVYQNGVGTGILRAILSVPGHACDGVFMGYFLGLAKKSSLKKEKRKHKYILLSIITPTLLHGFYDYCIFSENPILILLFFIFVIIQYVITIKIIKKVSKNNKKIKYNNNYCPQCGTPVKTDYCTKCGNKNI